MENIGMVLNEKNELKKEVWKESYEFISTNVGGYIQRIPLESFDSKGINVWCNEEGKYTESFEPSVVLTLNEKAYDVIYGNVVFTRCDKEGETISLTEEDINFITNEIKNGPFYMTIFNKVLPTLEFSACGKEVV